MASKRKFWRFVYQAEVLVDDEAVADGMSHGFYRMNDVAHEIDFGGSSGTFGNTSYEEVAPKDMARMLIEQGSDPEFFGLDEDGNDADEDENE